MDAPEQSPEVTRRIVRRLSILAPFAFVGLYLFGLSQGARWQDALVIAVAGLGFCLGVALLHHLRGSKAEGDVFWVRLALRFLARR